MDDLSDLDSLYKEARKAFFAQEAAKPAAPSPKSDKPSISWKLVRVVLMYQHSIVEPIGLFQEWACGGARRFTRLPDQAVKHEAEVTL